MKKTAIVVVIWFIAGCAAEIRRPAGLILPGDYSPIADYTRHERAWEQLEDDRDYWQQQALVFYFMLEKLKDLNASEIKLEPWQAYSVFVIDKGRRYREIRVTAFRRKK